MNMNPETLNSALSQLLQTPVIAADYQVTALQGGTVAGVYLLNGMAQTADRRRLPYRIVRKVQKKWERYGDPDSWRREYDLYASDLEQTFLTGLRWPTCYHAKMNAEANQFELWLEYIEGTSGPRPTLEMYEQAALEWGRYQGKLYAEQPAVLRGLANLGTADFMHKNYWHYRSWPFVHDYIRSAECRLPRHLSDMLIAIDEQSEKIFARIRSLPLVLCHRDFWSTNLIHADGTLKLLDWDTAGWGYPGEDLASLIADETHPDYMLDYYHRCIPAYVRGFAEHAGDLRLEKEKVYEMILLIFGYKLVESYLHPEDAQDQEVVIRVLESIYEMKYGSAKD
ncbi:aminoglycoside phosphotransferase family protein [Saccharibacillus alkalitolerans]|uniref:Aminoglycoside phosphotransferase family protein n=1 Tax=Saccharibacillus alkalitolerans TaxID=2705290 RepID=A0ABX0F6F5_9BACL|nr:aminoglycoside phosphotransferase family protein [Saccharibacillus alkalitolerans]NGZ76538.1 aminoglycoside phosphotransferase family protein [Saccharibacillus alkalitolerans]